MEFRILGPLEVKDGERAISLHAPKQRALLGVLLLHPNEVVSSERLIDELWGEQPPATAAKVMQTYVSQLRRALGTDAIVTQAPGYLLRIEQEALDAARFRRLAGEARLRAGDGESEQADALYHEALALWRGSPLADVMFESFARNEVERLGEERLETLVARIDCELTLGRHDELVTELETLVHRYPLRERLRAQLMLALYRSGRQADALAAYQETRRTLRDDLGLEPSHELQELERMILTHDASLEPPAQTKPTLRGKAVEGSEARTFATRRFVRASVLALAALLLLGAAIGIASAFHDRHRASVRLAPNSVGFIDARSGRVTQSFPVGRGPIAITSTQRSVWVANYVDQTVTRVDRADGEHVTIPVGAHPTGLTTLDGDVWVWTLEGRLVKIDPRFNVAAQVPLGPAIAELTAPIRGVAPGQIHRNVANAKIVSGGGVLWVTVPLTTVIRIDPANARRALPIVPPDGVQGPIIFGKGAAWVAGYDDVFPVGAGTRVAEPGTVVGLARSLAFGDGSLWVVSGGRIDQGVVPAVRRVDVDGRVVETTIRPSHPSAVASAGGSIWVTSAQDQTITRVDPADNRVVSTIRLGAAPAALAADVDGLWVAVG